jgi:hypothetical protein
MLSRDRGLSAKGAACNSLGQRPRKPARKIIRALKARHIFSAIIGLDLFPSELGTLIPIINPGALPHGRVPIQASRLGCETVTSLAFGASLPMITPSLTVGLLPDRARRMSSDAAVIMRIES